MRRFTTAGLLLAASFGLVFAAHAEAPLTETRVMATLKQIELAVRSKDVPGVVAHFASDAVIRLVLPPAAGGQTLELGVREYARMLEDGWALAGDSTYAVEDIVIQIAPDGRSAEVRDTTVESMEVEGRRVSSRTRERFSVESRGGALVITRLTGEIQM